MLIHFVHVASRGADDKELEQFKFQLAMECDFYHTEVDVVYIAEEDIINLQEALHVYLLPGNATLTKGGDVFRRPMYTNGDQSRIFFRELLKHDKEDEAIQN